jgi:hypothetical protein
VGVFKLPSSNTFLSQTLSIVIIFVYYFSGKQISIDAEES